MQAAWDALDRSEFRVAERAAREALARSPNDAEALYLLGSTLLFEGRAAEALGPLSAAFDKLRRRGVGYRLGHCHLALGDFARAEQALRRELQAHPDYANAHNALGVALVNQSKSAQALVAFQAALRIDPAHAEANTNAGSVLHALGRPAEALPHLLDAATLQPGLPDAHMSLGLVLRALQRHEEAAASFRRVLELAPDTPYALSSLVWSELLTCDWADIAVHIAALREQVRADRLPAGPFTLVAVSDSLAEQRQCAERHVRETLGAVHEPLWRGPRAAHPRIRLAYLSADFHEHATAHLAARLFELHDRSAFEVTGVSYGPDDGSPMRARLRRAFDRFVDVREPGDAQVAAMLRELEIDILVDLKGHTGDARLAILAHRPAPVQATYLGYPGTMGAPWVDYVLADRIVIPPEDQRFYTEKVVYLPDSYQVNDATAATGEPPSRAAAGLPAGAFVFCCFNNTYKLSAQMFDIWMRLLAAVPASVLWLVEHPGPANRNLQAAARARGIDPARLVFAPRVGHAAHLARQAHADLFLDTLPYNAHTTTSDALWAGVPVLTCLGASFAGRVAASLLVTIGLPELITRSLGEYEALALKLAREPGALASLREKLERNRRTQPLFDSARFCRHIEAAYRRMWEMHERGEPPRSFNVPRVD